MFHTTGFWNQEVFQVGIKQESLSGLEIWAFVHQKDPERMREPSLVASGSLEVEKQEDEAWSQGKQALLRPPLFTGVAGNCEGFLRPARQ